MSSSYKVSEWMAREVLHVSGSKQAEKASIEKLPVLLKSMASRDDTALSCNDEKVCMVFADCVEAVKTGKEIVVEPAEKEKSPKAEKFEKPEKGGEPLAEKKEKTKKKKKKVDVVKEAKDKTKDKKKEKAGKTKPSTKVVRVRAKEGMSASDAAFKVLKDAGKPLNKNEITEKIMSKGWWTSTGKTPSDTVKAQMIVEIHRKGKDSRFKKAGRGLFTLS